MAAMEGKKKERKLEISQYFVYLWLKQFDLIMQYSPEIPKVSTYLHLTNGQRLYPLQIRQLSTWENSLRIQGGGNLFLSPFLYTKQSKIETTFNRRSTDYNIRNWLN